MAFLKTIVAGRFWRAASRRCRAWSVALLLLAAARPEAPAQTPAPVSAENQIKAVFLFNFAQFVEWPPRAFSDAQSPIVIGVLGDDPFGAYLDGLVQGEKIGQRSVIVRRFRRVEDATGCHILFISRSEAGQLERIVAQLKGRCVLTVGDVDGFARRGGIVRFSIENGKSQLRINVEAAKAAELTISSKLLAHAIIVSPGKD